MRRSINRRCPDKVREDRQEGIVAVGYEAFRVELDSDNAFGVCLFNGFDHSVFRYGRYHKTWSYILDCLMVGGIYSGSLAKQTVKEGAF
jgi:hypothetical protein